MRSGHLTALVRTSLALGLISLLALTVASSPVQAKVKNDDRAWLSDTFSYSPRLVQEGARLGPWRVVYDGFGDVRADGERLTLTPAASTAPEETHAALIVSTRALPPCFTYRAEVTTHDQLRTGSEPNPWEGAWLVWDYESPTRFYYAIIKPGGWEVGERDPAFPGGQRFISTGEGTFPLEDPMIISVKGSKGRFTVKADGNKLTSFTDQTPLPSGRAGIYTEDAAVSLDNALVRGC